MRDATCRAVSSSSGFDTSTMRFNEEPFEQHYEIAEELGNGQFAVVRRVINRSTGEQFAAKFIKKRRYATSRRGVTRCNIEREVDVLRAVGGHEYTIKLFDVYETVSDVILVLELVSGGELFDHVSVKEYLDEAEAAAFIQQILHAIKHLHDNHVVHLDIKPENVMLRKRGESRIKLIDFGLSRRILPGTVVKDMIGTPEFVAPEVVNYEPLSSATDMWALGVVTYILLSGGSPFLGETRAETFVNISAVNYHFSGRYFEHVSPYAKDFIGRLFVRDQRKRATVDECLRHPWIRGPDGIADDIRQHSMISMAQIRSFKIRLKWRRAVDIVIACNRMTANARSSIRKALEAGHSINSRFDPDELIVSAILIACEEGNLSGLHQLAVLYRINLNISNRMGETAMHVSAGAGQFEVVHYLHMKGAAPDACDRRGDTPLFWAARNGHANIVGYLTSEENVNVNALNKSKESALHVATRYAQLESVLLLLERGADTSLQDEHGETALHIASWHGYAGLLGAICRFSPHFDLKNQGVPSFSRIQSVEEEMKKHVAATTGDDETTWGKSEENARRHGNLHGDNNFVTTNSIIAAAAAGTASQFHYSPSVIASDVATPQTGSHLDTTSEFLTSIVVTTVENKLNNLVELNNPIAVARSNFSSLISRFASISFSNSTRNSTNRSSKNSTKFPACTSSCSCLAHQLRNSAIQETESIIDASYPDSMAASTLPLPCARVTPITNKFVSLVTDMDQDWDQYCGCTADEETALHCAASRGHTECVQTLLDAGAPVDAVDRNGQTALHLALRRSHIGIALLLITKGCKLDIQDKNGDTALHIAARIGHLSAVQTLCHLGAPVDIPNQNSLTPLHLAAKEGHIEIVRCLCLFGANILRKNKDGLTAEIIALAQEHTQIGSLLSKMKSDQTRSTYVEQLCPLEIPLRRIKLKIFGHAGVGKTRLICALQSGSVIGSIIGAVQRRFSDNPSPSSSSSSPSQDEDINSLDDSVESNNNMKGARRRGAPHSQYTRGIDVQNVTLQGCGEFSVWEFGGYEPYHMAYDHFVGNTDCVHVIVYRCTDPTEIQYKQVLYWMNFLKGRVTPSEPITHCGIISRRSKVIIIGSHATSALFPQRNTDGDYICSDGDAMLKTVRLRFETHFDIHDQLILLDSTQTNCPGMKSLKNYLSKARESILSRLQKPLGLLDTTVQYISGVRKQHAHFPVITWPHFTTLVRNEVNPLAGDNHCRQLIQQLQLIGEVVYLRDEVSELDYVVLSPEWLGTHVLGNLLSAEFLSRCHMNGCYSIDDFAPIYPEIVEPADLLRILDTLQLCAPTDSNGEAEFEFPAFNVLDPPKGIWQRDRPTYVYGGVRVFPMRGMERSLQSTFPRIQVALRRSMHDFQDPMDADLMQWNGCSKMSSGQMESLIRLHGDAVEIQVRGPCEIATSCFYFLEDITNLVEQTAQEVAPGISLERHFLSPKHLREHAVNPAVYAPETIMAMQQAESLTIRNNQEGDELFTDVVCFGSRDVAAVLTLGIDVGVAQLQLASRCELAALLDPSDAMGRDWSILAVKLNLTDQLPEVDSTGQSLSRTDQLLAEWALQCPETATVGKLCSVLEELGRQDARDALYRTVPLYLFAPLDEQPAVNLTECADSGVVSSTQSTTDPRSASTLSR